MGKKGKRENEKSRIKRKEVSPRKLVFKGQCSELEFSIENRSFHQ